MSTGAQVFQLLVFPGFVFLFVYALFCEWFDRKMYATMQNRVGPPWFQPFADFVKLMAKESIVPQRANPFFFFALPTGAVAVVLTAIVSIPVGSAQALASFEGDLIVVAYLLTAMALFTFLAGWYSANPFSVVGALRVATLLIAYEVPLLLAILTPAVLAGSWSIAEIAAFFRMHPLLMLVQLLGLVIALIALQAKLERTPFDIPHAETEIVAGPLVEFTGRNLGLFHLAHDLELVVGVALIANIFLGGFSGGLALGIVSFVIKTLVLVFLLSVLRTVTGRIRVEQMARFCWLVLVPLALVQMLIAVIAKGWWLA